VSDSRDPQPTAAGGAAARTRHGLTLGLDCSGDHLALAIVDADGRVLASTADDVGRAHAALIVTASASLLEAAGVDPRDVALIGVGVGPGSYTGSRVAVATARGLGRAWGVPVAGVSSLIAVAGTHASQGEEVVAVSDARRGNVYAQRLRRLPGGGAPAYEELEPPRKISRSELAAAYPGSRVVEGTTPDAAATAMCASAGGEVSPHYL